MYTLQVEEMRCDHCVRAVTQAVQALDNAAQVNVDLTNKTVQVHSSVGVEDIAAAITHAGYPATAR